jgi:hypothetical protein
MRIVPKVRASRGADSASEIDFPRHRQHGSRPSEIIFMDLIHGPDAG